MQPLVFEPIIKRIRWGGVRLGTVLGKPIGDAQDAAESWEIADQPAGRSVVARGPFQGQTLSNLLLNQPVDLFGSACRYQQFPLLIKFLDANDRLSLQVHPNDQLAREYGPEQNGKTEAWVILESVPGSQLFAGLKSGVGPADLEAAVKSNRLEDVVHQFEVQRGDVVFVPAGTVHAIGEGILLAEVQQQSNLTFRLHDWGRLGTDGKPREIHIEDSLRCADFDRGPVNTVQPERIESDHELQQLVSCDHFVIRRHVVTQPTEFLPADMFRVLMVLEGRGRLVCEAETYDLPTGQTLLLPASCPEVSCIPAERLTILETYVP